MRAIGTSRRSWPASRTRSAHCVAVRRAAGQVAAEHADPCLRSTLLRGDRDDPATIGYYAQGHVDGLVGAHAVERRGYAFGSGFTDPRQQPIAVHHRDAREPPHLGEAGRAAGADDARTEQGGLLQEADADGTRGTVHQDRLAGLDCGHVQHLGSGRGGQQQVGGLLEGESPRFGEHVARRDVQVTGPAAGYPEGKHFVPDSASACCDLGPGADRREHAGDLVPDASREWLSLALGDVRGIRRVDTRRSYLDGDLAWPRRWHVIRQELEDLRASRPRCHPTLRHDIANGGHGPRIPRPAWMLRARPTDFRGRMGRCRFAAE